MRRTRLKKKSPMTSYRLRNAEIARETDAERKQNEISSNVVASMVAEQH